jgi:hypothetical protein
MDLIEERIDSVYKKHPGYCTSSLNILTNEISKPIELPTALTGEHWAFVQMQADELIKEVQESVERDSFGSTSVFCETLKRIVSYSSIPGIAVFSRRALPLSALTSSLEIASISADLSLDCLILETGISQRWKYGSYRKGEAANQEARAWERSKKDVKGLHFLAIQKSQDSDSVAGLWLLQTRELPII